MNLSGATALVTGANRGIGRHLAAQLVARGANVYATARRPELIDLQGVERLALDITSPESVAAAAALATDVDLLINNAGIATTATLLGDLDAAHADMDTNVWGTLNVIRSFAPVLAANGGGSIVNIASGASWLAMPGASAYAVSKAALWNMGNALRHELAGQGTAVMSVHLGVADTDMTAGLSIAKTDPADVARATLDGVERDDYEVVVDEQAALIKQMLARDPKELYAVVAQILAS
ncbi:short-chain dehydrogenase [Curtobacterium sp. MCJR17_055]|uniref:SDR family oxidoreductase n=1 Tax=unclassified Curtobacterium TaxID=257496 RepID=UPI000D9EEE21|nr:MULTISPECIES: SDR family oxidoreductase [unclassified Curtobacterium]PYY37854.1 short-chain dehydrogenase [Curtobacterium sp. MCBD17_029]PYY56880.1 short-chain dehydrogenase [Curtobacterium sp. MCJR17_055]PYY62204.1 short-chain dehydrogenase [Curtobacterium sp. MCPF17_015]